MKSIPDGNADMSPSESPNTLLGALRSPCWPPRPSSLVTGPSCCLLLCLQQAPIPHLPGAAFPLIPHAKFNSPSDSSDQVAPSSSYYKIFLESAVSPQGPTRPPKLHALHTGFFFPASKTENVPPISLRGHRGQRCFPRIWTQRSSDRLCYLKLSLLPWLGLNFLIGLMGIIPPCLPHGILQA